MQLPTGCQLAITVGYPLSGKSTFSKMLKEKFNFVIINPDTIRLALHGKPFEPLAESFVWANVGLTARSLLMLDYKILIDATSITRERRKVWATMAKEFNIPLDIFWIPTPKNICHERNNRLQRWDPGVIEKIADIFELPGEHEGRITIYQGSY